MKNLYPIKLKYLLAIIFITGVTACSNGRKFCLNIPVTTTQRITGSDFFEKVTTSNWKERDSLAVKEILSGNFPSFLKKFTSVNSQIKDSTGKVHRAIFFVSPDYLSVGTDNNWARIPLTAMAAQKIADSFNCFLPTRKIVDLIYQQAIVKLKPVAMFAFRDSSVTMWQHHLIIEGLRKGRKGLIAGIKKDVVISGSILRNMKQNREAIYGWHQLNNKPIQALYTGHINWWVDYSHGVRLIYKKIIVDGKELDFTDVMKSSIYKNLVCDEDYCDFFSYPY